MKKKILAILCVASMIVSLAACGASTDTTAEDTAAETEESTETADTTEDTDTTETADTAEKKIFRILPLEFHSDRMYTRSL